MHFKIMLFLRMNRTSFRPTTLAWLAAPALLVSLLLGGCNSQPTATETDKTATVVSSDTNAASDSTAVVADTTGTGQAE